MEIQQNISAELNEACIGKIFKVIIDRREGEFFIGRTEFDSPESRPGGTYSYQNIILNQVNFYNIQITRSTDFDLYGIPV